MKLIVANWKMQLSVHESAALATYLTTTVPAPGATVVFCPSFPALTTVRDALRGTPYLLGAQDLSGEDRGALTGQVSGRDLKDVGCRMVIVGHSERRSLGETDAMVQAKYRAALRAKLSPILCVGETVAERNAGHARQIVARELRTALDKKSREKELVIAYEPVWAIGSGTTASSNDIVSMHAYIRVLVRKLITNARVRVLYGGSITAQNVSSYAHLAGVDGLLVGGASTNRTFATLIRRVNQTR